MFRLLVPTLAALGLAVPALAQDVGGLQLAPQFARGPSGLARPLLSALPSITAADVQSSISATDRTSRHQQLVARVRGDAGYLGGFAFGQPLSPSVQRPPKGFGDPGLADGFYVDGTYYPGGQEPVIINSVHGSVAVAVGNGNVIQQQNATGSGPIAQQQVATIGAVSHIGAPGGGAVNAVTGDGNLVQSAPRR
jgi:hypothetical protein